MRPSTVELVRGAAPVVALLFGIAWERWHPHAALRPEWRANLGLWLVTTLLVVLTCGACGLTAAAWAQSRGMGLLSLAGAPPLVALVATVLSLDAVSWAWHRANHHIPLLWRFHRVHHFDEDFHVTTALRFHPGEVLLSLPVRAGAIVLLGAPPLAVLVFEAWFAIANVLEHGNYDLGSRLERTLGRVLITPTQHRLHHLRAPGEQAANYGTIFGFWDRLARTFAPGGARERFDTGVPDAGAADPRSLADMLVAPLRR